MAAHHFLRPLLVREPASTFGLVIGESTLLASSIDLAVDSRTRRRGLLGRSGLPPDTALIIAPCSAIHTFGMRFPIDVIYAARDGRVLKITPRLERGRIGMRLGAFAVIEMAAGEADRHGLEAGHVLAVRPLPSPVPPTSPPRPRP